ncbi:MAG: hypothetical protein ACFFCZ_29200 [Promethearchaeota archaeon]
MDVAEAERNIMRLVLHHWLDFHETYKTKTAALQNAVKVNIKNSALVPDLLARRNRFHQECQQYTKYVPHIQLEYYFSRYCSDALSVVGYSSLYLPYSFLRIELLIGDEKGVANFLDILKTKIEAEFQTLGDFMTYVHRFEEPFSIPLSSTEINILELTSRPIEYSTRTFSQNIDDYTKYIDKSSRTIERSMRKLEQIGVLLYTVFIQYIKIGLIPYIIVWESLISLPEEVDHFFLVRFDTGGTMHKTNYGILLIPPGSEEKIRCFLQPKFFSKVSTHSFFWNFENIDLSNKKHDFPLPFYSLKAWNAKKKPQIKEFALKKGVQIDFRGQKVECSTLIDLKIIYHLTHGLRNQTIANIIKMSPKTVYERTVELLGREVVKPYCYIHLIGFSTYFFVYLQGKPEALRTFFDLALELANARIFIDERQTQGLFLFRIAKDWLTPFYYFLRDLETSNVFKQIDYGWIPGVRTIRDMTLPELWNEQEKYWEFPHHLESY